MRCIENRTKERNARRSFLRRKNINRIDHPIDGDSLLVDFCNRALSDAKNNWDLITGRDVIIFELEIGSRYKLPRDKNEIIKELEQLKREDKIYGYDEKSLRIYIYC